MTGIVARLASLFKAAPGTDTVALERHDGSDGPVYAVGDVHGCAALYRRLEERIFADAREIGKPPSIVLLGDVVDRGLESATMIDHLLTRPPAGVQRLCLRGNHEDMMLRFIEKPSGAATWLDFGGYETLMSYGMRPPGDKGFNLPERQLRLMIDTCIPPAHRAFLEALPYGVICGDHALVHAGFDHAAPADAQPKDVLLWAAPRDVEDAALTVVHGHTIVENVVFTAGRIAVDTGAYVTGRLSAVRLMPGQPPAVVEVSDQS
jgi:serine/threonine protein phosphatase 1